MICAVDSNILTLLLNPIASPPVDPTTEQPLTHCRERIETLVDRISEANGRLIVPAPVVGEISCICEPTHAYLESMIRFSCVEVGAFNTRCAIECADLIKAAKAEGDKKSGVKGKWQHLKIDYQIVAIAKVYGATMLYTDDKDQAVFARKAGLDVFASWEIELSSEKAQYDMNFLPDGQR